MARPRAADHGLWNPFAAVPGSRHPALVTATTNPSPTHPVPRLPARPASLAWRVVLVNSVVMLVAALALALGPATVSSPVHTREAVVLVLGVCATLGANLVLVRRAFAPLEHLTCLMHKVDPLVPGRRLQTEGAARELQELADAFNAMLQRLEDERRESARRALRAQEAERRRVARELHDELGQTMTGVLLRIDEAIRTPQAADLEEAREDARHSLEEVRRIARDLRPDTLIELGLQSALNALATRLARQARVTVERRFDGDLPPLDDDAEIVVYRVAQEALTNVARHADATRVVMSLHRVGDSVTLTIDDDGRGIPAYVGPAARGITGMRERALLVSGRVAVGRSASGGTRVTLRIPAR
jgi:two-component system, NarL family, sensor histidine kinase UhpB